MSTHRTGPSPALGTERFTAEESPSFDKRLTPVVPASWPETEKVGGDAPPRSPEIAPPTGNRVSIQGASQAASAIPPLESAPPAPTSSPTIETKEEDESPAVTPSQRAISISLAPSPTSDHPFWDSPPKYSVPPPSLSEPPLPKPSRRRSLTAKLLFTVVLFAAITLLCYEASIVYHVPWLDPRWLMNRIRLG